jgi:hypothetical protein
LSFLGAAPAFDALLDEFLRIRLATPLPELPGKFDPLVVAVGVVRKVAVRVPLAVGAEEVVEPVLEPSGLISRLARTGLWPVCWPTMSEVRLGAQTVVPQEPSRPYASIAETSSP